MLDVCRWTGTGLNWRTTCKALGIGKKETVATNRLFCDSCLFYVVFVFALLLILSQTEKWLTEAIKWT